MSRSRLVFLLALVLVCASAIVMAIRGWTGGGLAEVREVAPGHQEIAWIAPATSSDSWERLVAALELLAKDGKPGAGTHLLRASFDKAFLPLTADVPEVALFFEDAPDAKLWLRWYKLTGENPSKLWFEKLLRRSVPPLAVIGGDTSDHALSQARALQEDRTRWPAPAPLYCITTATAERHYPRDYHAGDVPYVTWPKLMDVYEHRTFRFCFTNARMVEAVLDFVQQNPRVWRSASPTPRCLPASLDRPTRWEAWQLSVPRETCSRTSCPRLPGRTTAIRRDLGEIFMQVFAERARPGIGAFTNSYNSYIDYSVGPFLQPNPREAIAVNLFLAENPHFRDQPQLLALPTGAQPARRFLRALCRRAPLEVRNVVVVTGDAIAFNNVYRDREVAWNIQDMPVPLVFFSHRNPVDAKAGFGAKEASGLINATGTQDVLLNRDIIEALVLAAFDRTGLVADSRATQAETRAHPLVQGPDSQ